MCVYLCFGDVMQLYGSFLINVYVGGAYLHVKLTVNNADLMGLGVTCIGLHWFMHYLKCYIDFLKYLVDPASSYMLVSKIKPCMSKYKSIYVKAAYGSLKQL